MDEAMKLQKLAKAGLRKLIGPQTIAAIDEWRNFYVTRRAPDRIPLLGQILPAFAKTGGRILWVGCRRYTASYPARLECEGAECWTLDIDPQAARFGRTGRHIVGDLRDAGALFDGKRFDAVLCNGVFGYGVDTREAQAAASRAMAAILEPGGLVLIGWNTDKIEDPHGSGVMDPSLEVTSALGLPERRRCAGTSHIYDLYSKSGAFE